MNIEKALWGYTRSRRSDWPGRTLYRWQRRSEIGGVCWKVLFGRYVVIIRKALYGWGSAMERGRSIGCNVQPGTHQGVIDHCQHSQSFETKAPAILFLLVSTLLLLYYVDYSVLTRNYELDTTSYPKIGMAVQMSDWPIKSNLQVPKLFSTICNNWAFKPNVSWLLSERFHCTFSLLIMLRHIW